MTTSEETKRCCKCKEELSRTNFHRHRATYDGLQGICKECTLIHGKANRSKIIERYTGPTVAEKICTGCEQLKDASEFGIYRGRTDGLQAHCRACAVSSNRRRKTGFTPDEYSRQIGIQDGKCAICESTGGNRVLQADHCHVSLRKRFLLCHGCNVSLGVFKDSPETLTKAIAYLIHHGAAYPTSSLLDYLEKYEEMARQTIGE